MTRASGGRPKKISHADVISAARALGMSGLTVKAVADELKVSVQALYYHVKDANDLRDQVAEHLMEPFPIAEDKGQGWADWAYAFAHDLRDFYEKNPGLAQHATSRVPQTRSMLLRYDTSVRMAMQSGFRQTEADWATRAVVEFVAWWVARTEERATNDQKNALAFRRKIHEERDVVPTLASAVEAGMSMPAVLRFDFTLRALINGLSCTAIVPEQSNLI